jgi:hypothetical protein
VQIKIIAAGAWVLTGLIAILGLNAGRTVWFYMEPVIDTVPNPASYYIAATAGILALFLSLGVSIGVTVHAGGCNTSRSARSVGQ